MGSSQRLHHSTFLELFRQLNIPFPFSPTTHNICRTASASPKAPEKKSRRLQERKLLSKAKSSGEKLQLLHKPSPKTSNSCPRKLRVMSAILANFPHSLHEPSSRKDHRKREREFHFRPGKRSGENDQAVCAGSLKHGLVVKGATGAHTIMHGSSTGG